MKTPGNMNIFCSQCSANFVSSKEDLARRLKCPACGYTIYVSTSDTVKIKVKNLTTGPEACHQTCGSYKRVWEELAKWKDEYHNVCKFANQYEGELADARAEIDRKHAEIGRLKLDLIFEKDQCEHYEKLAAAWMELFDELKNKYEPLIAEIAAIEAEKERE